LAEADATLLDPAILQQQLTHDRVFRIALARRFKCRQEPF